MAERSKTKKEIVEMLLKKNLESNDEEELINMLIDEPIAVDTDKQSDINRTFGDKVADKITEIAGSWNFIICMVIFLILWIILNQSPGAVSVISPATLVLPTLQYINLQKS